MSPETRPEPAPTLQQARAVLKDLAARLDEEPLVDLDLSLVAILRALVYLVQRDLDSALDN